MKEEPWEGVTPSSTSSSCRWSPPFGHSNPKPWQSPTRLLPTTSKTDEWKESAFLQPSASEKTPKPPHLANPCLPFPSPTAAFPRGSSKMSKTCSKSWPAEQITEIKPEIELINKLGTTESQRSAQWTCRGPPVPGTAALSALRVFPPLVYHEMGAARTERNKRNFEGCCSFSALWWDVIGWSPTQLLPAE